MKKILITLTFILLTYSLIQTVLAQNEICVFYFYGIGCPHCTNVKPILDELEANYPNVHIHRLEMYHNKTNYDLFNQYCSDYQIDDRGIPFLAINQKYFMGDKPIIENLENEIILLSSSGAECPLPGYCGEIVYGNQTNISPVQPGKKVTIPLILATGLADGINPCAFSVLIFLLVYLVAIGRKKKLLIVGLSYVLAIYISYFFAGLGLLVVIQRVSFGLVIQQIAGFVAILFGLLSIKDFFWYGKGPSLKIPASAKPLVEKLSKIANPKAAFILGFLVSAVELPCTGGIYLSILALLSDPTTKVSAVPYLLIYNLVFILPLVIILILAVYGISLEKMEKWRKEKRRWIRLILGIIMILLGSYLLFWW